MKKNGFLTAMCLCFTVLTIGLFAQNNVGIGTTSPHTSALLDLTATNKGFLVPRVILLSVTNNTSPVNSPATGLLVYNTSGSLTTGFWYWNGTQWIQLGAGGGGCSTLDQGYDCGGAGAGRSITADAGSVNITLPLSATNEYGLTLTSNKGTTSVPSSALYAVNTQHGTALFVETTLGTNLYGAIQASSVITNANTAFLPGAISGYKSGAGIGTGVYGEAIGTGSVAGAGVTGMTQNNNFGGDFYAQNFVGLQAESGDAATQALQVVGANANTANPSILAVGRSQFQCSNVTPGHSIIANSLAGEATWASDQGSYGFLGTAGVGWWYMYYYNATALSRRDLKRDIHYVEGDISEFVMEDIEKIKPAFYKFNVETDEFINGKEAKVRYNMHMGLILDETPDYIQDNTFNGIDVYALSTLAIAGVKHNRNSIMNIENRISAIETQLSDFGTFTISGNEVRVQYNRDFHGAIPVVTITPLGPVKDYYISSIDDKGFVVTVIDPVHTSFNWIAMSNYSQNNTKNHIPVIDNNLLTQLRVDELKKAQMFNWANSLKQDVSMELKGYKIERNTFQNEKE